MLIILPSYFRWPMARMIFVASCRLALDVYVARLEARPTLSVLWPDDKDAEDLSVRAAPLFHVFADICVVIVRGLVVDLQYLIDLDDRTGRRYLHGRQGEHAAGCGLHTDGHATDHAHRIQGIVRSLDRHRDAQHQHTIKLQRTLSLLKGGDLAEAVVGALVSPH